MKVIISTGGTGGHIFCGLSIADELRERGVEVVIVGSKEGLLSKIVKNKYPLILTSQKPFRGKSIGSRLKFPLFLLFSIFHSIYIMLREKPCVVIGTGGFSSFSPVFVASLIGIPTLIIELDSIAGLTTRVLSLFVSDICLCFDSARNGLPSRKIKVCGIPVRKDIKVVSKSLSDYGLSSGKPTVLVFGGSRGAKRLNEVISTTVNLLPEVQFIWQCGDLMDAGLGSNFYRSPFIEDMGSAYGNADLVVSRAGALTIGEIMSLNKPSILIPYPYSAGGHQLLNARYLEGLGLAVVILERDLTSELLASKIREMLFGRRDYKIIVNNVKESAVNVICNRVMEICESRV